MSMGYGSWFWAVGMALGGKRTGRPCYPRLAIGMNDEGMLVWFQDGKEEQGILFDRDDIEALDWEIRE